MRVEVGGEWTVSYWCLDDDESINTSIYYKTSNLSESSSFVLVVLLHAVIVCSIRNSYCEETLKQRYTGQKLQLLWSKY